MSDQWRVLTMGRRHVWEGTENPLLVAAHGLVDDVSRALPKDAHGIVVRQDRYNDCIFLRFLHEGNLDEFIIRIESVVSGLLVHRPGGSVASCNTPNSIMGTLQADAHLVIYGEIVGDPVDHMIFDLADPSSLDKMQKWILSRVEQ